MRPAGPASRLLGALLRLRLPVAAPFARDMMLGTRRTRRLHPFMHRPWPRSRARRLHRAAIRADRLLRHPPTRGSEMGSDSRSVRVFTPPRGGTASKSMTITGLPEIESRATAWGLNLTSPPSVCFFSTKFWPLNRTRGRLGTCGEGGLVPDAQRPRCLSGSGSLRSGRNGANSALITGCVCGWCV